MNDKNILGVDSVARCEEISSKTGKRCSVPVFKLDGHFCLMHSKLTEAAEIKSAARLKGAKAPKNGTPWDVKFGKKIDGMDDLLNFQNKLLSQYRRSRVSIDRLRGYCLITESMSKVLQAKKVSDRIDDLEEKLRILQEVK